VVIWKNTNAKSVIKNLRKRITARNLSSALKDRFNVRNAVKNYGILNAQGAGAYSIISLRRKHQLAPIVVKR
jgi:hypothetical protein